MNHTTEAVAAALVLTGFVLFGTSRLAVVGGLLIAGGAYALLLPHLADSESGASADRVDGRL